MSIAFGQDEPTPTFPLVVQTQDSPLEPSSGVEAEMII